MFVVNGLASGNSSNTRSINQLPRVSVYGLFGNQFADFMSELLLWSLLTFDLRTQGVDPTTNVAWVIITTNFVSCHLQRRILLLYHLTQWGY